MTLNFRDRRCRNCAEITVVTCEQKSCPLWFLSRPKSYPVWCESGAGYNHSTIQDRSVACRTDYVSYLCKWSQVSYSLRMKKSISSKSSNSYISIFSLLRCQMKQIRQQFEFYGRLRDFRSNYSISYWADGSLAEKKPFLTGSILSHSCTLKECDLSNLILITFYFTLYLRS